MKDFNEREDFLLGRALSEDARNKRNDRAPNRFGLRACDFYALEAVGIQDILKNFASQKNTLTSSLPQRCRALGTYGSGNDTLVNVFHVRAAAKRASNSGGTGRSRRKLV